MRRSLAIAFAFAFASALAFAVSCSKQEPVGVPENPTFTRHVAPIIFGECAACHREGEPAPFTLLSYRDVKKRAEQIVEVTQSRYMPPWLPEPGHGRFADERRLTDDEIETIRRWFAQGAVEGDAEHLPDLPEFADGWQLGEPDIVVAMPEAFELPADGRDVYRHFVLDVPIDKTRFVKAIEFRPGDTAAVHHAFVLVDESGNAEHYDAEDSGLGYGGMDAGIGPTSPDGHFISWQPGKVYHPPLEGMSWTLKPSARLVLQVHMQTTGKVERIQSKVGLFLTARPPQRLPFKIVLSSTDIDIPANGSFEIKSEYKLPVDAQILGMVPHAHYLGKALHGFAILPDGSKKWLIRIDDWDFNWQGDYRLDPPVLLPAGSVIHQHYTWDNTAENPRNPNQPPQRVVYGPETTDEMGELWLQLLPRNARDYAMLNHDYGRVVFERNRKALGKRLEKDPNDVTALVALGKNLMTLGRAQESLPHLDKAIQLDPSMAEAFYIRGMIRVQAKEMSKAKEDFDACVALRPDHLGAQNGLGNILMRAGRLADAKHHYRVAVETDPENPVTLRNLGVVCLRLQQPEEALDYLNRALALDPQNPRVRKAISEAQSLLIRKAP